MDIANLSQAALNMLMIASKSMGQFGEQLKRHIGFYAAIPGAREATIRLSIDFPKLKFKIPIRAGQ